MFSIAVGDWSGITGDPVKFGLGLVSMVYDAIFMLQHYVWYPAHGPQALRVATYDQSSCVDEDNVDMTEDRVDDRRIALSVGDTSDKTKLLE